MRTAQAQQLRSLLQQARRLTSGGDDGRYLDLGIELRVVRQDLSAGVPPLAGLPPVVLLRTVHLGGMYDRTTRRFAGPSRDPIVWYVGEKQCEVLLDPLDGDVTRILLYAAEGAGKTRLMAQWLIVQALRYAALGVRGYMGATAPTGKRVGEMAKAICDCVPIRSPREHDPTAWGVHKLAESDIHLACGITIQLRATKKHSDQLGSPIQGYTWLCSADDELQDTAANGANQDIEARLRGAKTSRRMCSATAKDSPGWRTFRDEILSTIDWRMERIPYTEAVFIWADHWERLRRQTDERGWKRRGLALDVGPEHGTYMAWDREYNLVAAPAVSFRSRVRDVTGEILGEDARGQPYAMLLGHDPGEICDVTLFLRCWEIDGEHCWWVVDEVTTTGTSEHHIITVRERLRHHWGIQGEDLDAPRVLVRCDPQGTTERRTDAHIYTMWRSHGFDIRSAAYTKNQKPQGRISKRVGIDMVNTLFCNSLKERRLFIAIDDKGAPAAPKLLYAIENSERDKVTGEAEIKWRGKPDLSHWCASLRYALWHYEKPRHRLEYREAA